MINLYWFTLIIKQLHRNFLKFTGHKVEEYVDAQREHTDMKKPKDKKQN